MTRLSKVRYGNAVSTCTTLPVGRHERGVEVALKARTRTLFAYGIVR